MLTYVCSYLSGRLLWATERHNLYLFVFIYLFLFISDNSSAPHVSWQLVMGIDLSIRFETSFFFYSFFLFGNLFFKAYQPLEHQLQAVGCVVSNEAKTPQDISYRDLFLCSKTRKRKTIKYGICLLVIPVIVLHPRGIYQFK